MSDTNQSDLNGSGEGQVGSLPPAPLAQYSKEELAFHKLFPGVPLNEKLVEEYGCSLSKMKILRPGQLFCTAMRLCFHSKLHNEDINVMWQDVTNITKKSKLFVSLIDVETSGGTYTFTAFSVGALDSAFKTLQMLVAVRSKYASIGGGTGRLPNNSLVAVPSSGTLDKEAATVHPAAPAPAGVPAPAPTPSQPPVQPNPLNDAALEHNHLRSASDRLGPSESGTPEKSLHSPASVPVFSEALSFGAAEGNQHHRSASTSVVLQPDLPFGQTPPSPTSASHKDQSPSKASNKTPSSTELHPQPHPGNSPRPRSPSISDVAKHQRSVSDSVRLLHVQTPPLDEANASLGKSFGAPPVRNDTQLQAESQSSLASALGHKPSSGGSDESQSTPPPIPASPGAVSQASFPNEVPAKAEDKPKAGAQSPSASATPTLAQDKEKEKKRSRGRKDNEFDFDAYTAQNKANMDILKNFPKVPKTETILDMFQCSFVAGVHRIGKLYITQHFILFNSMLMAEPVCIPFTEIETIFKQQTALILDGISIAVKSGEKYDFTSFLSRDSAFMIMKQLFDTYRATEALLQGKAASASREASVPSTTPKAAHNESGNYPPPSSPSSTPIALNQTASGKSNFNDSVVLAASAASNSIASSPAPTQPPSNSSTGSSPKLYPVKTNTIYPIVPPESFPAVSSLDYWDKHGTEFEFSDMNALKTGKVVFEEKSLPKGCDLNDVFRVCFDDNTQVNLDYHLSRKETENRWDLWKPCSDTTSGGLSPGSYSGQRTFNCITIIKALTATACPFTEFQKFVLLNHNGTPMMLLGLSGQARGVMFSESFRVEQLVTLVQQGSGPNAVVTMKASVYMRWITNPWIKGKITTNTMAETTEAFAVLFKFMQTALQKDLQARESGELQSLPPPALKLGAAAVPTLIATAPALQEPESSPLQRQATEPQLQRQVSQPRFSPTGTFPPLANVPAVPQLPFAVSIALKAALVVTAFLLLLSMLNLFLLNPLHGVGEERKGSPGGSEGEADLPFQPDSTSVVIASIFSAVRPLLLAINLVLLSILPLLWVRIL